ncbi:unnamed protein product [Coregonus sp. 'balchen']|nr:unnamed protein product [Coregonus sp. 'balchen']
MAASSCSSSLAPLVLLIVLSSLSLSVESRPSPQTSPRKHDIQVLDNLFSAQLRSLILNQPDVTFEGSTSDPAPSYHHPSQGLAGRSMGAGQGAGPVVPRLFLDFLRQQRMFRGRSRKSATARGCFGMKVDRIGSISGLGC